MSSASGCAGSPDPLAPKTDAGLAWSHDPVVSHFPVTVGVAQEVGLYDSSFTATVFVHLPPDLADFSGAVILGGDKVPEDRYAPPQANDALRFTINWDGKLTMAFGKDSLSSHAFCRPGMWEHIAFVYDKATCNQMIFINGREICSSSAAGKASATYTGCETICFGHPSALDSFVALSSWPGSMKEARIYTSAMSAHDIAGIAGIVPLPPPCVPLVLKSHPDQALVLAPGQETGDGKEMLNVCLGPASRAILVTFDYGCVRLAEKPELALNIGSNRGSFQGHQHGTRLAFGRFHGDLAQRFQINYDGTISPQFQDACEGLVIGIQPVPNQAEGGEAEGTLILAQHFCGQNTLKFQIPEAALSCFPVGVPDPGKDMIRASLLSHPGKQLVPNSDFQELPPSIGLEIDEIDDADDDDPLKLAFQGGTIRLMRGALDLLTLSTRLYYDDGNQECYEVMLSYFNSPHRGHKFKVNGDGTISAEGIPGLVVGLSSFRHENGCARLELLPNGDAEALVFEDLVRSLVVTVAARPGANAEGTADISCVDMSGKEILVLSMQPWESLSVLRRRCAEAAGVVEVSVKMATVDGVALAGTEMISTLLMSLSTAT